MKTYRLTGLLLIPLLFSACAATSSTGGALPAVGAGAAGAALGAGVGGIVGSVIANGDKAASALTGALIGVPVAVIGRHVYIVNKQNNVISKNNKIASVNYESIEEKQEEIDFLKEKTQKEIIIEPGTAKQSRHYIGSTVGY